MMKEWEKRHRQDAKHRKEVKATINVLLKKVEKRVNEFEKQQQQQKQRMQRMQQWNMP